MAWFYPTIPLRNGHKKTMCVLFRWFTKYLTRLQQFHCKLEEAEGKKAFNLEEKSLLANSSNVATARDTMDDTEGQELDLHLDMFGDFSDPMQHKQPRQSDPKEQKWERAYWKIWPREQT